MDSTLTNLKKIDKNWCYEKQNIVRDENGRSNYTRHIFYINRKNEPEYIINHFREKVEIIDNVLMKTKNEEALLSLFANSLTGGK